MMMLRRRFGFLGGLLTGVVLVFAVRWAINRTPVADWLVAPLIVPDTNGPADALVVMGAGVTGPCLPNQFAMRRVLLAAEMLRTRRAAFMVISGNSGRHACPVALAMADFARQVGVPDDRLYVETLATSTHENADRVAPLLRGLDVSRVLLVTDTLHMRRAEGVFAQEGFRVERASVPVYSGHEDNVSMLQAGLREYLALAYYRLRGWLRPLAPAGPQAVVVTAVPRTWSHPAGPIVLLGASYAAGWNLPSLAGHAVINRGTPGERSTDLVRRFEADVLQARPRAVIIWGLINDITRAEGDVDAAVGAIRDSYLTMIRQALEHGVEPILVTEVTMGLRNSWQERAMALIGSLLGKPSYQDGVNARVLDMDAWLKGQAHEHGLRVLDLQAAVGGPGGRRRQDFVQDDGSHITHAGYVALSEYAVPIIERHLRGTLP